MPLFDAPNFKDYPRRWSEYSLDYKLFFGWMGGLMAALIVTDGGLLASLDSIIVPALVFAAGAILLGVSLNNRSRKGWRWPRPASTTLLKAAGTAALMGAFLFVFLQGIGPGGHIPWPGALFAISIGIINVLMVLKLVQPSQQAFEACCGSQTDVPQPAQPADPNWKRAVRGVYSTAFLAVWLVAMGFFYLHQQAIMSGSPRQTATQTATINEHGTVIYVTEEQKRRDDVLMAIMMVGIPAVIASGFFLQFVAGIALFGNLPPSGGIFSSRK